MRTPYDAHFYGSQRSGSHLSPREVVPLLMQMFAPKSVVDVGCGEGPWIGEFYRLGVQDVIGIDGNYVDRKMLQIPQDKFVPHDLTRPLDLGRKFDLAVSLEVAEHLPPESAEHFVGLLTSLAPVVLFSAAIPGQGGVSHVNEQWQSYWAGVFNGRGYAAVDCIRPRVWNNPNVLAYYAQNIMLYVAESTLESLPQLKAHQASPGSSLFDVVHPRIFQGLLHTTAPENIRVKSAARQFLRSAINGIRRRIGPSAGIGKPGSGGK